MKRNLKVTISALAVMLVMALAVTVVSFTLADNENKGELVDEAAFVAATVDTNTNIDNIIENSYATGEGTDPVYRVVEIGSGAPSSLKNLVESGGFKEYVIDGNTTLELITIKDASDLDATIEAVMKADCITYQFFKASEVTDESADALAAISNADFIYISNDASNKYSTTNDMGEELYNILHTYAVGDYKPLVIDDIGRTDGPGNSEQDDPTASTTVATVVNNIYEPYGISYYAYRWDMTAVPTAEAYLSHHEDSDYLGINGSLKTENWTEVTYKSNFDEANALKEGSVTYQMADILVITAGTPTMSNALFDDLKAPLADVVDISNTAVEGDIYDIKTDSKLFYQYGYNARYARPDFVRITEKDMASVETETLDKYDLVILEADTAGVINQATYKKLASAMYGQVNIVYASTLVTDPNAGSGSTTTGGNASVQQETNYSEIFYMVATNDGQERYENIMVTTKTEFDIIATSNSASTCKVIADLINSSAYRGNGGPKGSANKFTVLEIQPCYPIDTALADKQKDYYKVPADVVNGQTKEELDADTEYYAWELSKAKIAEAFNISADQINIVHMSTEQLASSKEEILGNYDLIYIGGNTSALKSPQDTVAYGTGSSSTTVKDVISNLDNIKKLPLYSMYTHSGPLIVTDFARLADQGQGAIVGKIPTSYVDVNGDGIKSATEGNSYTLLNGNDITYSKLIQLEAYVDAGMPVVFSSTATAGYRAVVDAKYEQNSIDPDSNMYKFMKYCGEATGYDNILWDLNENALVDVDNNGGAYGNTKTGLVKVFDDTEATKLTDLYAKSEKRPKITLTQSPAIYNMYDDNSIIKNKQLNFGYKITGSANYTVDLYIDDDGNSVFASNEKMASGDKDSLEFTASDSFYGPVYWKLVVTDVSGMEASTTGISYIANSNTSKQPVKILQIMPGTYNGAGKRNADAGETAQGRNTLYFCTVCQQAYERLEFNPTSEADRKAYVTLYDGRYIDKPNGVCYQSGGSIYLGIHEHEFGIVKYESSRTVASDGNNITGCDDWDSNLADEVRDKYNFDIEIMMRSEFVDLSNKIASAYDYSDLTDAQKLALTNTNPYTDKESDEYKAYEEAELEEKLNIIYKMNYDTLATEAYDEYEVLNSLIYYDEETFEEQFAEYQYFDELKLEISELTDAEKAACGYEKSALDAEIDLRIALRHMIAELGATSEGGQEIQRLLETRHYWDYYCIGGGHYCYPNSSKDGFGPSDYTTAQGEHINTIYQKYIKLKDTQILANSEYKKYSRYANGSDWMFDKDTGYDMVIIGASENFAGDDFIQTESTGEFKVEHKTEEKTLVADNLTITIKSAVDKEGVDLFGNWMSYSATIGENVAGVDFELYRAENAWSDFYKKSYTPSINKLDPYGTVAITGTVYQPGAGNDYNNCTGLADAKLVIEVKSANGILNQTFEDVTTNANGEFTLNVDNYVVTEVTSIEMTDVTETKVITDANGNEMPATVALANLEDYLKNNGKVLMFHDTVTRFEDEGSTFLTNMIRKYSAMDRYKMDVATPNADLTGSYYVPYTSADSDKYFMTNQSVAGSANDGADKYTKWWDDVNTTFSSGNGFSPAKLYISDTAYTDAGAIPADTSTHAGQFQYKYATQAWSICAYWLNSDNVFAERKQSGKYGADKAAQTNEGIVTLYPFTLSDQLNISPTHAQPYALDLEDEDLTVWYTMAGGTGVKSGSSVYAASPYDGMDSYFIYTYKNFNYCGAGHANVTGILKDNNDERRLYINIICNSVKKSIREPDIYVYDYNTTENKNFKKNGDQYVTKVDTTDEYPEFSFLVRLDEDTDLSRVRIYYDLDFLSVPTGKDPDEYIEDKNHKLILDWDNKLVAEDTLMNVFRYDINLNKLLNDKNEMISETYTAPDGTVYNTYSTMLKLQPSYFDPYNGQYTYIVIEVTDSSGGVSYKRIKVQLKDKLFNLT